MTNSMEKLSFPALTIDGKNYLSWSLDVEAHLTSKDLQDTVITDAFLTMQQKAKALILLGHHLVPTLKEQDMNEINPRKLWDDLELKFKHMKSISLPAARHDWINLRMQDHTSITKYNSELFCIVAQLKIFGHPVDDTEQIERTLSTFHPTNLVLASQYRNMNFTLYSELIAHI